MPADEMAVPIRDQEQDNWCWAAVTQAVIDSFPGATHRTQCEVAARRFGRPCCDLETEYYELPCSGQATLQDALEDWGHHASPYLTGPAESDSYKAQIEQLITDQIAARRPVCAQLRFGSEPNATYHFILIRGYSWYPGGGGTVIVEDPLYGPSEPDIEEVIYNYANRGGEWINTFLTRP